MDFPWKLLSFDDVWRDIKTTYGNFKLKVFNDESVHIAVTLLTNIGNPLQQNEMFVLLNEIAHEKNDIASDILRIP